MTRATTLGLALLVACQAEERHEPAPPEEPRLRFEPITLATDLYAITDFGFLPEAGETLVAEKSGRITHLRLVGDSTELLGSFDVPGVFTNSDCGLVSLAADPDFASNHLFYAGYCLDGTTSSIGRFTLDTSDYAATPASLVVILSIGHAAATYPWHNVGSLGFEPDGTLWALFGDKTVSASAQDPADDLGALLRLIPSRTPDVGGYTPAAGNPFDAPDSPLIYAQGLRSPWRGLRDHLGRYWIGDVGAATTEEINVVTLPGDNLAWPVWEGPCDSDCDAFVQPVVHWDRRSDHPFALDDPHTPPTTARVAWVGAEYIDEGDDPYDGLLTHRVTYGDFCAGWVRLLELDETNEVVLNVPVGHLIGMSAWRQAADGYLYASAYGSCTANPPPLASLYRVVLD